jgi:hypothetical protein
MLKAPFNGPRPLRAACAVMVLAAACAGPAVAQQTFVLPEVCISATGDEGDDPVVLVSLGTGEKTFTGFTLLHFVNPVSWGILIKPYRANTYNIFTTYTPFLTSDRQSKFNVDLPSLMVPLPDPGVSGGREMQIWNTFTVTIMDAANKDSVPNAFVDFIPAFPGSSPYTMQADAQGHVVLNCVQQVSSGYRVTVYGADHNYLYDGSFPTNASSLTDAAGKPAGSSRSFADPSQ